MIRECITVQIVEETVPTARIHDLRILVHVDSWDDGHPEINPRFEKRS